ncbi:MAG: hypothetical protein RR315_00095 [Oscillospiraceae bacterium]
MTGGIVTLDLHGKTSYAAKVGIDAALRRSRGVYRLRLIHGYNKGTVLRDMIEEEYSRDRRVLRLVKVNEGTTDLVLKEL